MKSKLSGLEPFDTNHLIAIFLSLCIILLVPIIGKIIRPDNRKNFIYILISIALIQEIVDYVSRYNFDGFNLAEDSTLTHMQLRINNVFCVFILKKSVLF